MTREALAQTALPTDDDILSTVTQARDEARDMAAWVGMEPEADPDCPSVLTSGHIRLREEDDDEDVEEDEPVSTKREGLISIQAKPTTNP